MVLPAPKLFRVIKGATFDYRFQYKIQDAVTNTPFNLTGHTGTWTLRQIAAPHTVIATYATGASANTSGVFFGGDTNDLTTGIIDLVISAIDTAAIAWNTASHNFSITDGFGVVTPLLTGSIGVVGSLP